MSDDKSAVEETRLALLDKTKALHIAEAEANRLRAELRATKDALRNSVEAEVDTDRMRAELAEVRALADEWEGEGRPWVCQSCGADNFGDVQHYVDGLRAVLGGE